MKRKKLSDRSKKPNKKKYKKSLPSFPSCNISFPPRSAWETDFTAISCSLRKKDNWTEKVFNKDILKNWKKEIKQDGNIVVWKRLKSELQWLAKQKKHNAIPSSVDCVWFIDSIIPDNIKNDFMNEINIFSNQKEKDWHPWSNNIVNDIIHPSLYCYVHGITPILEKPNYKHMKSKKYWNEFIGTGQPQDNPLLLESLDILDKSEKISNNDINVDISSDDEIDINKCYYYGGKLRLKPELLVRNRYIDDPYGYNTEPIEVILNADQDILYEHIAKMFQWIPCDISVSKEGKVTFDSYINNIHPFKYKQLYKQIGLILEYIIPLWNQVLRDILIYPQSSFDRLEMEDQYGISMHLLRVKYEKLCEIEPYEEKHELLNRFEQVKRPKVNLRGHDLQVIVKIASIELTPEKPVYNGVWHVEGTPTENILATGIYYYMQENINENFLQFREAINDPYNPKLQDAMGFIYGRPMNRNLGDIETKQDRLIAFPNIMQHCISKISLKDKTKPGYRKFIVFFLVNPNKRILSSSSIPPYRQDWLYPEISYILSHKLPPELCEIIIKYISSIEDINKAKKYRYYLMLTRKYYTKHQNEKLFERHYSYCEH